MTDTAERSHVMSLGFNMQAEFTKLAQRIVAPVAAKLTMQELEHIVGEIGYAFEQFNARHTTGDTDFQNTSVSILEPVRPKLSGTDFARIVDRLRGAMAGFCQRDRQKRSLIRSHGALSKLDSMHNRSLKRSHGGARQSKLWRCSSCYGSVRGLIGNCTDGGTLFGVASSLCQSARGAASGSDWPHQGIEFDELNNELQRRQVTAAGRR